MMKPEANLVLARRFVSCVPLLALVAACDNPPAPQSSYYDDNIRPILQIGCAQQTAPCHLATPEGTASGNLDLSSYDSFMRRADVLPAYGPYPVGLLLLKGGPSVDVSVDTFDPPAGAPATQRFVVMHTDIRHAAGSGVRIDATGYPRLEQWIEAGHTRTGIPVVIPPNSAGSCRHGAGAFPGFDATVTPPDATTYNDFLTNVQPILEARCAYSSCHGSPIADFYLSCGESEDERRWNYFIAKQHLNVPDVTSEILRRPLSKLHGGTFHEGGTIFLDTTDPDYQTLLAWAQETVAMDSDVGDPGPLTPGLTFFADYVQPMLVRKGCMFLNCHSTAMFHDLRLRGGSQGAFSRVATRRNYEMSRLMLAIDAPDPNASRIIAKNLYPPEIVTGGHGVRHRGGSLFEEFGDHSATAADCAGIDATVGDLNTIPAYCVLAQWHQVERTASQAAHEVRDDASPVQGVVWIERAADTGTVLDFDTFRGGTDLRYADATLAAGGGAISLGAARSLLGGCAGLSGSADIRTPAVSWDGTKIAFAARTSATAPLQLWWMNADGSGCVPVPDVPVTPSTDAATGILIHDFDPAFAPDGRLVFASTRGNISCANLTTCGPTRTPAAMTPNSNLYIYEPAATPKVRQLTFLLNDELAPTFMLDGRVIFTSEKREEDFHQLAIRRENLDGGDYHPLFAQRGTIGFETGTEVTELANRNFAFVAGHFADTHSAGTIAIVNRSIGPDQGVPPRDPADHFYVSSMRTPFSTGTFRSPSELPSTHFLASCDLGGGDFELCDMDPVSGTATRIGGAAGRADIEAVAIYARPNRGVFVSRPDEANAHTTVDPTMDDAIVNVHDFPMIETLLFANIRTGRPIDPAVGGFDVVVDVAPPASAHSFADVSPTMDSLGMFYSNEHMAGHVPLYADGSAAVRFRGGEPIRLRVTDTGGNPLMFGMGAPFTGVRIQREEMQFYPGERSNQSFQRTLFNGLCAGCHGSISGRELDQSVNIDVLTSASRTDSYGAGPTDLYGH